MPSVPASGFSNRSQTLVNQQQWQGQQPPPPQHRYPPRSTSQGPPPMSSRQWGPRAGPGPLWNPQQPHFQQGSHGLGPHSASGPIPFRSAGPSGPRLYRHGDYEDRIDAPSAAKHAHVPREPIHYRLMHQDDLPAPDPRALYFPRPLTAGQHTGPSAIITPRPFTARHISCYTKHTPLRQVPNKHYPLKCQACLVADTEPRWTCAWCSLRICRACVELLDECGRDLSAMVARLNVYGEMAQVLSQQTVVQQ